MEVVYSSHSHGTRPDPLTPAVAARMGGDSIVEKGPAVKGVMSFDVYKCAD
jgi:hypothetical protein